MTASPDSVPVVGGAGDDPVVSALMANPVFSVLGEDVLRQLAATAKTETFKVGQLLLSEGEEGKYGYMILDGSVSVDVATPAGDVCVAQIGSGRLIGEIGALADVPRTASVRALTPVNALRLDRDAIRDCMGGNLDVAMNIIGRLGLRLQQTNRPMALLTQAAEALRNDAFSPDYLDSLSENADEFSHFADVFKNMAAELKLKQSQRQELETAQSIQHAFLPSDLDLSGHGQTHIDARMIAAKHVGGDFFDYFKIGDDRLGFVMADVAGKGIPAALFMARTLSVLRAVATSGLAPDACMTRTNALISEGNDQDMFVTVFYGELNLKTGRLTYCNAGHEPAVHVPATGEIKEYGSNGPALGLFDFASFSLLETTLEPGDMLISYTDGVTEAFNPAGDLFGEEKLMELIAAAETAAATAMIDVIMNAVDAFADGRDRADDTTVLALVFDP